MPLIPQQNIVVVTGPYKLKRGQDTVQAAAEELQTALENYPPCRIISLTGSGIMHGYSLTAVVETV